MAKQKNFGVQKKVSFTAPDAETIERMALELTFPEAAVIRMLVREALAARQKAQEEPVYSPVIRGGFEPPVTNQECTVCGNCEHDHRGYTHEFARETETVVLPVEANTTYSVVFGGFQQPVTDPETIEVLTQGACVFHGLVYTEHDFTYGPQCRRCGAQDQEVTPGT
jgi:hypothetical protein